MTHGSQTAAAAGAQTAPEVLEFAAERGVEMVDLKFVDLPGTWQHMTLPLASLDVGDFDSGLGFDGSSIRGFQEIHESDMLLIPDPSTAFIDPYYTRTTLSLICSIADPVLGEPYSRDPRFVAQKAERHLAETGIADVAYLRPRGRVLRVRPHRLRAGRAPGVLRDRLRRGLLEHRPSGRHRPEPRLQAPPEGGLLPGPAGGLAGQPARRDGGLDGVARDSLRVSPPRGLLGRPGRDRHALPAAAEDGRPDDDLQVRGQERGGARGQDGDVHAQADLRGERLRHARPPVAVEGRRAAHVRGGRLREPVRPREALHRRAAHPRPGVARVLRPDDELVSPARARLRGAGQPRLLRAQPQRLRARPDVPRGAEDEADRVPLPGPDGESRTSRSAR